MRTLALAWRQLRRDLAAGELRILFASLVLAVMAVTAVGFLTDRAQRALSLEANRLLGGDAVLRADEPIGGALRAAAQAPGLRHADSLSLRSMVGIGENVKLGELRALGDGYPLRGRMLIERQPGHAQVANAIPARGSVWLNSAGAQELSAKVGDLVSGKVTKLASFGAFVGLQHDIDGLVHISQVSEDRVDKIKNVLKVDQDVTARVIKIDKGERRIGLSIKAANYSPEQLKAEQAVLDSLKPGEDLVALQHAFDQADEEKK